ncbi:MAG TPA: cytochrome d ubiquinol oxidase subunit II [Thermoanaerobaculia bacterium]|jgi:cytochrome d ubiquinol oxidase subunit II|nr:cytochrome d ubiquinol oxidase subunit II [Thermoanaerobaculia bacterium]
MSAILDFGLPEVTAVVTLLMLNAYVLTGGADFGGGVWDLFARGPRRGEQRQLIAEAIGPIWEANHVWLVVVVVMLFGAFPPVFSLLGIVLHIPLTAMLVGIVLRGCAFVFRKYGTVRRWERHWGRMFASASLITPVLLGVCVGAVAGGAVGRAAALLPAGPGARAIPSFVQVFVAPWLALFPMVVGILALALFAFLAAVYLTLAAPTAALRHDFRRYAYGAAVVAFGAALGGLLLAPGEASRLGAGLASTAAALALRAAIAVAGLAALLALRSEWWCAARIAAAALVSLILWDWALAQYPYLVPFTLTICEAAAPRITLQLLLGGLAGGSLLVIPALAYLFRTFSGSGAARADVRRAGS